MARRVNDEGPGRGYLDGQFLIAMPSDAGQALRADRGLCLRPFGRGRDGHHGQPAGAADHLPRPSGPARHHPRGTGDPPAGAGPAACSVHRGGPVETGRGFVLHSADYFIENSTLPIDEHVCLTATLEILKAIAAGTRPESAMLALGYAGWAPGQLETEIQANGWLHCRATPELIFDSDLDGKYDRALASIGIDLGPPLRRSGTRLGVCRSQPAATRRRQTHQQGRGQGRTR